MNIALKSISPRSILYNHLEGASVNRDLVILVSVAVLGLASCDSAIDAASDTISEAIVDTVSADPSGEVASLLEKNDPAACANPTAIDTALAAAHRDYASYVKNGGQRLRMDTISATAVDNDIHEITCSSMIHYQMTNDKEFSVPFRFKLRPMLGDGPRNFVAEAFGGRQAWAAVMWHMAWWKNQSARQVSETTAATTAAPDSPSADTASADGEEYPDDCLIVIRGKQKGGRKCLADSNGRNTFYLNNESGQVQYNPELPDKKVWQASWIPKEGEYEDLGSLRPVGKCLKSEIATIC